MADRPLTEKQKRFIEEYQIDGNAARAARAAGYAERYAGRNAHHVVTAPKVAAELELRRRERADRFDVTADGIVAKLATIGFANIADFVTPGPNGEPVFDVFSLDRERTAALSELDVVVPASQEGGAAKRVKLRLPSQRAALTSLARLLGNFKSGAPAAASDEEDDDITFEREYVSPSSDDR